MNALKKMQAMNCGRDPKIGLVSNIHNATPATLWRYAKKGIARSFFSESWRPSPIATMIDGAAVPRLILSV